MNAASVLAPTALHAIAEHPHCLGLYSQGNPGPVIVAIGSMHGNEPGGVLAAERVLSRLANDTPPFNGTLIALKGNVTAYEANQRFITRDLNRLWYEPELASLRTIDPKDMSAEDRQQKALFQLFEHLHNLSSEPVIFIDLHSTSSHSHPFCMAADTLRNRRIAFQLPLPLVLGLEESINGTMLGLLSDWGHITMAVEGGQHVHPNTSFNLESVVWLALVLAGNLDKTDLADYDKHENRLKKLAKGFPSVSEVRYRHKVEPGDRFIMEPGFSNFQPVKQDTLLAQDCEGPILAAESGLVLMPLYQSQGEDGFFLVREVMPAWLHLSALLRRLHVDKLLPLMPGIRKHPHLPDHFITRHQSDHTWLLDLLHMLGYRKRRIIDGQLIFSRRRPDHVNQEARQTPQ
ncbi:MAG: succinylglutamate desuccinylase/aspartoacylase family protein [Cyanobacteria bacterium HKST-UBA04]|nr:succinylglutamate desuccinylase/aspartoacylase family protein [Cyanobacteria bacterium HKST-UBA04]